MSKNTKNYKLFKYEDNDNADLTFLNNSMDIIDGGLTPFFVAVSESANIYKITTGLNLTTLENGFSIRIAIPGASFAETSLIVDTIEAIPIKKVNGKAATNLKSNGVYNLTYYNGNFIVASSGGDESETTITSDKVLSGTTFISQDGEKATGNMANNGALNATIGINGTYNIPKGYTEGGKVTQSIATQGGSTTTPGTANKTIVAANKYVTGNIIVKGDANLIASNILSGKSIFGVAGSASITSLGGLRMKTGNSTPRWQNPDGSAGTPMIIDINVGFTPIIFLAKVTTAIVYEDAGHDKQIDAGETTYWANTNGIAVSHKLGTNSHYSYIYNGINVNSSTATLMTSSGGKLAVTKGVVSWIAIG